MNAGATGDPDSTDPHPRPPRWYHGRAAPDILAVMALGGMIGASARYGITQLLPVGRGEFPLATFLENLAGSFLLGFLLVQLIMRTAPNRYARPFLATGVLGAFTTMSTYQLETYLLLDDGYPLTALAYAVGSLAAGLVLAHAGIIAGRRLSGQPHRTPTPGSGER